MLGRPLPDSFNVKLHSCIDVVGCRYAGALAVIGHNPIKIDPGLLLDIISFHTHRIADSCCLGRLKFLITKMFKEMPEQVKITVDGVHEGQGSLLFKIVGNGALGVEIALAAIFKHQLGKEFHAQKINVTPKRIQPADQGTVGMDRTAIGLQKDAGAFIVKAEHGAAGGITGHEIGGGDAQAPGHAGGFIRVELNFLEAATGKAAMTGKAKGGLAVKFAGCLCKTHDGPHLLD
jgi:hypothetical protein